MTDGKSNERRSIDKLVSECVGLIQNTGFTLINVVHLRKNRLDSEGNDIETVTRADIHGSGAFAKFSHAVVGIEKESEKNTVKLKILANRDVGFEGYADTLKYNEDTGRLELKQELF
jgi:hypothetical protein